MQIRLREGFAAAGGRRYTVRMGIEKVVKRTTPAASRSEDIAYWRAQPPGARLEALTAMVNEYYGLSDETPHRLQRVLTVTKRPLRNKRAANRPQDIADLEHLQP